jgi:predicted RNA binding protein YcfA (HicA-like mRNA interferase family)
MNPMAMKVTIAGKDSGELRPGTLHDILKRQA